MREGQFQWPEFHSRYRGSVKAANQAIVDEIDDLMDLVLAERAAKQAGNMLGRFVTRNPNTELGERALASAKEVFNDAIDEGAELERKRRERRTK